MEPTPWSMVLPSSTRAPALARRYVQELGSAWSPEVLDLVLLAVSETVTNAVRYGLGGVELRLALGDGVLRVEVSDANPEPPVRRPVPPDGLGVGGLGLHLLDAVTAAWGTSRRDGAPGKTVWLLLPVADGSG